MTAVLLGADVGGSHTAVALARPDLTILARAEAPGTVMRMGMGGPVAAVIATVAKAAAGRAGVVLPADRAVVGAAGAGREAEQRELSAALLATGVARQVSVRGDGEIALAAAFGNPRDGKGGIFINAGTGSIAYARDPSGVVHRSGGYGWQLGDEGGGYWLGRRALQMAGQAHDGHGDGAALLSRVLAALGLQDFDALIRWSAAATPGQVASLAPHLLKAAHEGDAAAQRTIGEAATALVDLIRVLIPHFPEGTAIAVAMGGGLLQNGSPLAHAFRAEARRALPAAQIITGIVDAVVGALRLAADPGSDA